MSGMRNLVAFVVALGVTLVGSLAHAQGFDAEVRIDQLQLPTPASRFTRAEGPVDTFDEGIAYAFRIGTDYMYRPIRSRLVGAGDDTLIAPVEHALLLHLGASITPVDWLTVEAALPFAIHEEGEDDRRIPSQPLRAGKPGIGDIRAGIHFVPYNTDDLDVMMGLRFWAASGSEAAYLAGDDKFFRLELVPSIAGEIDFFLYGCTMGIAPLFFAGRDGDRAALSCGAHFKVAPTVALGVEPHLALFAFSAGRDDSQNTPGLGKADLAVQFETLGSLRVDVAGVSFGLAAGPGIGGAPGTPDARAMLTIGYADKGERRIVTIESDRDLDGLSDDEDECPDEAGPRDRDGCPSVRDQDGDGIIDGDACPDDPGPSADDPDANGCPDRDNDHLADPVDACPDEPGDDGKGCPQFARLKGDHFEIAPPVQFPYGQARLQPQALDALREVMRTLRTSRKVQKVSIALGTQRAGQRLTDLRAAYILNFLGEQDVDSSRYELELKDDLRAGRVEVRVVE